MSEAKKVRAGGAALQSRDAVALADKLSSTVRGHDFWLTVAAFGIAIGRMCSTLNGVQSIALQNTLLKSISTHSEPSA